MRSATFGHDRETISRSQSGRENRRAGLFRPHARQDPGARQRRVPAEYVEKLGSGFDGRCVRFLGIRYEDLVARLKEGGTDEEIFQWAFERGRKPSEEDMENWNEFMRKCGWKDVVSPILDRRKKESGLQNRDDIETMFQYIDVDEGRA